MELREFIEQRIAEDELWALACSAPNSWRGGHQPIATGVHWTWAVGDNWEPYPIDPLEEYAGESAHDTSPCLVTVERWPYSDGTLRSAWKDFQHQAISRVEEIRSAEAGHIARHDPARVLREVAGKRVILEEHVPHGVGFIAEPGEGRACQGCGRVGDQWANLDVDECRTLRGLALAWSEHPGYQKEWAP